MRRAYLALTAMLVGPGCASTAVEYKPVEVLMPVAVPCAAATPPEPEWATKSLSASDDVDVKTRALLAELKQREAYEEKLRAATAGCRS